MFLECSDSLPTLCVIVSDRCCLSSQRLEQITNQTAQLSDTCHSGSAGVHGNQAASSSSQPRKILHIILLDCFKVPLVVWCVQYVFSNSSWRESIRNMKSVISVTFVIRSSK